LLPDCYSPLDRRYLAIHVKEGDSLHCQGSF